ncbi:unnamed protein product [Caretta caretta]
MDDLSASLGQKRVKEVDWVAIQLLLVAHVFRFGSMLTPREALVKSLVLTMRVKSPWSSRGFHPKTNLISELLRTECCGSRR